MIKNEDNQAQAVQWYVDLCDKWKSAGVDGYKEDLYGYEIDGLPDDKSDAVNAALMDKGVYIMGRNGYEGSAMDIARFNDFNYNQNQDRGPINGLAFAYSGFPYVYPAYYRRYRTNRPSVWPIAFIPGHDYSINILNK